MTAMELLPGFRQGGSFSLQGRQVILLGELPEMCGVYAWVIGRIVVYIGYAWNLRARQRSHRNNCFKTAPKYQRKHLIELARALKDGKSVRIMIATPKPSKLHGLPVNMAIGLEDALIGLLKPDWNAMRKNPRRRDL